MAAEALLDRILDAVAEGVLVHEPSGTIRSANRAAQLLLGLNEAQLVGRPWSDLPVQPVFDDGRPLPALDFPANRVLANESADEPVTIGVHHDDGKLLWLQFRAHPVILDTNTEGAVCSFIDITQELEAARLKSEFVSIVSHELRTPTACITSAVGLIGKELDGSPNKRISRLLEIATANSERLSRLIDDILDIERIANGRASLDLRQIRATELLERAAREMEPMAESADVSLVVAGPAAESWLWADPDLLVQALVNLLSNAIKFSDPGSTVELRADHDQGRARLAVTDCGRGIPPEDLDRVFQHFAQVDASDSRVKGGTGLGLAICSSIANQHGGDVEVVSEVGVGSTFTLVIPARVDVEGSADERDHQRPTVVVCCADPTWRPAIVLTGLFDQANCSAERLEDVEAALALARQEEAEAFVLDVGDNSAAAMTEIERLASDPIAAEIPVVLIVRSRITDNDEIEYTMRSKKVQPIFLVRWIVDFLHDALTDANPAKES